MENLRVLTRVDLKLNAGVNWICGQNGAGKTSILEALAVLAKGRSFRSTRTSGLIQTGSDRLRVVAWCNSEANESMVLGVDREARDWAGRIGGQPTHRVSDFARRLPMVVIEPGSHALVDGPPELRRQFLDWTLFHVEQDYLSIWKSHARLLRQRNAALRDAAPDEVIDAIDLPLVAYTERLHQLRRDQCAVIGEALERVAGEVGVRVPAVSVAYRSGWPADMSYADALAENRNRDRELGFTARGPQRGELEIRTESRLASGRLSRGQQKLVSLSLLLAQHECLSESLGYSPLLLLDDPVSELDQDHLTRLMNWVFNHSAQIFVTAVETPQELQIEPAEGRLTLFHVEQGNCSAVVQ